MKPRVTVITLGVDDLQRAVRFYRDGLGLKTDGIVGTEFENGAVAFFELQAGLKLALWPRTSIARDTALPVGSPTPTEFTIGHNVSSKADVDAVMGQAKDAGAVIVQPAHDTFWGGYAGYFQDPDGHLWKWYGIPSGSSKSEPRRTRTLPRALIRARDALRGCRHRDVPTSTDRGRDPLFHYGSVPPAP